MYYYLYKITNLINEKIYIGLHQTEDLNDPYMGSGKLIRAAIKKYGKSNFRKEILEFFDSEEAMALQEEKIVTKEFVSLDSNYNLMPGGKYGSNTRNGLSFKDCEHTEDAKIKIGEASGKRTHKPESKIKISKNNFSRRQPELQRQHASNAGSYSKDLEHRKKISESLIEKYKDGSPNLGKVRTKHTCPHCGKIGAMNVLKQWHFEKCKNIGEKSIGADTTL